MLILTNYDFNKNEIQNVKAQNLSTDPANPVKGQFYFNTTSNRMFWYNGTTWVGADSEGATMTGANIVAAINGSASIIDDDNLSTNVGNAISKAHSAVTVTDTASINMTLTGQDIKADAIFGTTSGTICQGNDSRLSDARTPSAHTLDSHSNVTITSNSSGEILKWDGSKWINNTLAEAGIVGTGDSRLTDARTPTAHASTHITNGSDVIANFTSTASGLVPLSGGGTTKYLRADGTWVVPPDTNTTYSVFTTTADGLVPKTTTSNTTDFLRRDGTWATPPDTDTVYTHPTTAGNKHLPSGGSSGQIIVWSSDGTGAWGTNAPAWANITNKPTSTVSAIDSAVTNSHTHTNKTTLDAYTQTEANLASAVSLKHSQNTDTGTSSATFQVGTSGPKIKNSSGEVQMRNSADSDYADLRVKNLVVEGTTTTVNSETVELADNKLLLNSNITTNAGNDDGGIAVKRLMADNTTRKDAEVYYDTTDERWKTKQGAVTGTLVSATIANKVVAQIGNGALTSIPVTHNLNTRDCTVLVRETASPYAMVMTDVEFTDLNTITFKFAVAPTSNQYTVTIIG